MCEHTGGLPQKGHRFPNTYSVKRITLIGLRKEFVHWNSSGVFCYEANLVTYIISNGSKESVICSKCFSLDENFPYINVTFLIKR